MRNSRLAQDDANARFAAECQSFLRLSSMPRSRAPDPQLADYWGCSTLRMTVWLPVRVLSAPPRTRSSPSAVRGPVLIPPCIRQRPSWSMQAKLSASCPVRSWLSACFLSFRKCRCGVYPPCSPAAKPLLLQENRRLTSGAPKGATAARGAGFSIDPATNPEALTGIVAARKHLGQSGGVHVFGRDRREKPAMGMGAGGEVSNFEQTRLNRGDQNVVHGKFKWEKTMLRLIAVAFALALASSAQAMPLAPLQQPDNMVTTVREACGAGMHRVNGVCIRTAARRAAGRAAVRCATGMRVVEGRCIR